MRIRTVRRADLVLLTLGELQLKQGTVGAEVGTNLLSRSLFFSTQC